MSVEIRFEPDPDRVEYLVKDRLVAADIVDAMWRASKDPAWTLGMRSLWFVPADVDLSDLDLPSLQRDIVPEVPKLRAIWGEDYRQAWIMEGPVNPLLFDMWKFLPEAVHSKRFQDRDTALAWLSDPTRR